MKTIFHRIAFISVACLGTLSPAAAIASSRTNWVETSFREVDTLLANPGQGWMNQRPNSKAEPRFPCSVVYIRFNWAEAEPEPGKYNWAVIDGAIAGWKARGATVSFRVMTCNPNSSGYHTSPKWLFDSGCKGAEYVVAGDDPYAGGERKPRMEPDYADPIYLARQREFLTALAQRYNGSPDVEFIDIGSYGYWGEWHTLNPTPAPVRQQIVDMYLSLFPQTPLVFMSDDEETLGYALAHGTGIRRDGVGSPWHEKHWIGSAKYAKVQGFAGAWQHAPVVFEWYGNYDYLQVKHWSFKAAVNFMLKNHVTLINDNVGRVPAEAMPLLEKLARLAGARFVLRELEHEKIVKSGGPLHLDMKWANAGVGKIYRPYRVQMALVDAGGKVAFSADSTADPIAWIPGKYTVKDTFSLPADLPPGAYTLALALVDPSGQHRPFQLAIDAPQSEGRYTVGSLTVE